MKLEKKCNQTRRRKDIIKIREEINEILNRKTRKKIRQKIRVFKDQ